MKIKLPETTPGPWKHHLGRGATPRFHIQTEAGYQIASTTELNSHKSALAENDQRLANARAIASLPECLAALAAITTLNGNLPDSSLEQDWYGPNDGKMMACRLLSAIEIARAALLAAGATVEESE